MFNGNLFHLFYSFGPATEYLWPNKQSMWTYGPKYRVFRTMVLNTRTYRVCGHMVLKTRHTDYALSPNDAFSDREEKWWHHISEIMGCHWIEYSERTRWKQSPQIIPYFDSLRGRYKKGRGRGRKTRKGSFTFSPQCFPLFPFSRSLIPFDACYAG